MSTWRQLISKVYALDVNPALLCFPQLDIVQQEYIHESGLEQFEVVKAAFDASGSWLATVEERKQKAAELELNLKLWAFDEQTQRYSTGHLQQEHSLLHRPVRFCPVSPRPRNTLTVSPAVLC